MDWERINAAIKTANELKCFFIASADQQGRPHVATASKVVLKASGVIEVSIWFCPKTLDNLQGNKQIALIIWDADNKAGYQLLGRVENMQMEKVLDGFAPEAEKAAYLPQACWLLTIHVDTVMEFIHALHSDVAL